MEVDLLVVRSQRKEARSSFTRSRTLLERLVPSLGDDQDNQRLFTSAYREFENNAKHLFRIEQKMKTLQLFKDIQVDMVYHFDYEATKHKCLPLYNKCIGVVDSEPLPEFDVIAVRDKFELDMFGDEQRVEGNGKEPEVTVPLSPSPCRKQRADDQPATETDVLEPRLKRSNTPPWEVVYATHEQAERWYMESLERDSAYICVQCLRRFPTEGALTDHAERHSESAGRYSCSVCNDRFRDASERDTHLHLHYTFYRCVHCGLETGELSDMRQHAACTHGVYC